MFCFRSLPNQLESGLGKGAVLQRIDKFKSEFDQVCGNGYSLLTNASCKASKARTGLSGLLY